MGYLRIALVLALLGIYLRRRSIDSAKNRLKNVKFEEMSGRENHGRKILVTGGCGILGSTIVKQLLRKYGDSVQVVVFDVVFPRNRNPDVSYIRGNVTNREHVDKALKGVDSVIACAALLNTVDVTDEEVMNVNVHGMELIVNAAKMNGCKYLVFTSSCAALLDRGKCKGGATFQTGDEDLPYPKRKDDYFEVYGYTKMLGEKLVMGAHNPPHLSTVCLRPSIIFGRNDVKLAERLLQGLDNALIGPGVHGMDFIHVESVANAHVLAEEALANGNTQVGGKAFFIGAPKSVTYKDFMHAFENGPPDVVPLGLVQFFAQVNEFLYKVARVAPLGRWVTVDSLRNLTNGWWFPPDRARAAFGYEPEDTMTVIKQMVAERKK